ncbi:proline--tRNA ligase [Candidatus Woesearchaeota archaeon]|nr:proline--tRNA ligase [Candidatus Woesearchaeota archaeon]MBW3018066.1 proline--tRNA ligase [Candidatus Woesearchaeota archaeon]
MATEGEDKKGYGLTVKKEENFSEWYTQVIQKADLADYTSVSGCIVFKPYSYAIWEKIKEETDKRFKALGIKNAYFPLFIPESLLTKEAEHVEGFAPEVAWVTQGGNTPLNERLAIRPTSEAIMYESYAKWIRSWRDLPLRLNQWNNVVRWEFKHPVPFLRTREFLWNEGHTAFATQEEAEKEIPEILNIYKDVVENYMALYGLLGKKTDKEKFAGAEYTCTFEYFMPSGKAIQGPDAHHDGQKFAKAYNIKFLNKEEKEDYAWQNTWAITTRMLGVMIATHGDDKGLVLPPRIAPNKIVIVPIFFEKNKEAVLKKVQELGRLLKEFAPIVDDRDEFTPGYKFNEWEMKGVPIRVELGPRDLENDQAVLVRRDTGEKETVKLAGLKKEISLTLEVIQENLFKKTKKFTEDNTVETKNWDELVEAINNKKLVKAVWCGETECEDWIKDKTGGAKILNIPFDQPHIKDNCPQCGKEGKYLVYIAKSY